MIRRRLSRPEELDWITPNLAIGSDIRDINYLKMRSISALIGLQAERPDDERRLQSTGITYLHLPIKDGHAPELAQIQSMVDWVNQQRGMGRKVYMHCAAGVGRAPTMAIAYLVSTGLTVDEAYAQIKRKHPDTDPGPKQFAAVREYEALISSKETPELRKIDSAGSG